MKKGYFDVSGFFAAVDAERIARKKTWKQVAVESGLSASTLTRMAQGKKTDLDGMAALAAWSGLDPEKFIRDKETTDDQPEPLAMISTYLWADKHLTPEGKIALDEIIKAAYKRLRKD